ncbi:TPR repeat-containing protein yrrB [Hondaea fermentalgiana]|uniref:TPR repeat-containing protein yrrB n=1 Tax=Hondaea fermentalgiana TaxID=2315210 RepID=A0A2R5GP46_9STRA|nr:TPR repeat-containing protein yrrB [Hondaea fermentalgiana]|eukprot:GBG32647.1 TPR repeat-containing protein yrrB [Hondaea fermentalgiana]
MMIRGNEAALRVKGGTARNGVPMKTIYVFGPESTGTRFMTRSLSKLFEPTSRWDGEYPACKTHIDPEGGGYVNIQHLSLPWGGWCDGAIRIVPEIDMCNTLQKPKYGRFFVDIETLLKRVPNARAIVLSRDAKYTMRSVLKHHCSNRIMAAKEHQTALDLISKAVESPEVGNRVLRVEYESLGLLPELTWSQIMRFADIQRPANFSPPAFRSGNHPELPIIFQLYPSETKRNGIPVETIFVIGPEATGTRFMARSLSRLIDPGSSWNGELPGCVTHKASFGYVNIQHLSLPWGGLCDGNVRVLPSVDMCNREIPLPKRFFIDVTETLRRFPRAKAIVLRRDMAASMRSIADIHCRNATFAKMEYSLALKLIKDAFDTREIAQRLLRVDYEALGIEPETTWRQVTRALRAAKVDANANATRKAASLLTLLRGVALRGVAWRGVALRGVARRGVAWRGCYNPVDEDQDVNVNEQRSEVSTMLPMEVKASAEMDAPHAPSSPWRRRLRYLAAVFAVLVASAALFNSHKVRDGLARMEALARSKLFLYRREKQGTERYGTPMKTIFVFGPESSGTRFMTRTLSHVFEPESLWDGEIPACVTHIDPSDGGYVNIQHLSLPWGDFCNKEIRVVPNVDMCDTSKDPPFVRFFVDIEEALRRTPNSKAVVLTRDPDFALRSVLRHHCFHKELAVAESYLALQLIERAINSTLAWLHSNCPNHGGDDERARRMASEGEAGATVEQENAGAVHRDGRAISNAQDDLGTLEDLEAATAQVELAHRANEELQRAVRAAAQGAWSGALRGAQHIESLAASVPELQTSTGAKLAACLRAEALMHLGDKARAQNALTELYEESLWRAPPWAETNLREFLGAAAGRLAYERGLAREAFQLFARVLQDAPLSLQANKGLGLSADALLALRKRAGATSKDSEKAEIDETASLLRRFVVKSESFALSSVEPVSTDSDGALSQRVLDHLQRAVAAGCSDAHVLIRVGALLAERQEWDEAARILSRAVKRWPSSADAHLGLARVLRARSRILRNEFMEIHATPHAASQAAAKLESDNLLRRAISHLQQAVWLIEGAEVQQGDAGVDANANVFDADAQINSPMSPRSRAHDRSRVELAQALVKGNRLDDAIKVLENPSVTRNAQPLLARLYLERGRAREAEAIAQRELLEADKFSKENEKASFEQADAYLLHAEVILAQHKFDSAEAAFVRAEELAQHLSSDGIANVIQLRGLLGRGHTALGAGKYAEAANHFQAALELANDDTEANLGLARSLVAQGKAPQAADYYWTAFQGQYENNLGSVETHVEAARVLVLASSRQEEARAVLQAAATLWPRETTPLIMLAHNAEDETVALVAWQRALHADPTCMDCMLALARLHMDHGRAHRALEIAAAAHRIHPAHAETHLLIGRAQAHLGHLEQAKDSLDSAIELAQSASSGDTEELKLVAMEARVDLATVEMRRGVPSRSLELLQEANSIDSKNSIVHRSLALLLAAQGKPALAKEHELEATRLSQWSEALVGLPLRAPGLVVNDDALHTGSRAVQDRARASSKAARNNQTVALSLTDSRVAKAAREGVPLSRDVGGLMSLGLLFAAHRDLDAAADCFEHVIAHEASPLAPRAELELGVVLLSMGDRHMALHHLSRAMTLLNPNGPAHLSAMLWTAHAVGKAKRLEMLQDATRAHPEEPAAFHALGVELASRSEASIEQVRDAFLEAIASMQDNSTRAAADAHYRLARLYDEREPRDLELTATYLTRVLVFTSRAHHLSNGASSTPKNEATATIPPSSSAQMFPWSWAFETVDAMHARTLLELGSVLRRLGRPQDASDLLVDAIDVGAGTPALRELSYVYAADGQSGPALWFARASSRGSLLADTHLLRTLRAAGQIEEAVRLTNATDDLESWGLLDEALDAVRSAPSQRARVAKIVAARSRARAASAYASQLATFPEDLPRAIDAIMALPTAGERAYALVDALRHASPPARAALAATSLAKSYSENSSAVALAVHEAALEEAGTREEMRSLSDATAERLESVLGNEFTAALASVDAEMEAFAAHLLIAERLSVGRDLDQAPLMSSVSTLIHAHLARHFFGRSRPMAAAMHAWWALSALPKEDRLVKEMHILSAWACHDASALVTDAVARHARAVSLAHFTSAGQTSGRAFLLLEAGQPREAVQVLRDASSSSPCELAMRGLALLRLEGNMSGTQEESFAVLAQAAAALHASLGKDGSSSARHNPETLYCAPDGFLEYAERLQLQKQGEPAAALLDLVVSKMYLNNKHLGRSLYALGSLKFHLGHFDEAVRYLEHPLLARHIGAANNLGAVFIKQGEYERAIEILDRVLVLCDERAKDTNVCKESARVNLAFANEEIGRIDTALLHARTALKALEERRGSHEDHLTRDDGPEGLQELSTDSENEDEVAGDLRPVLACQLARLYRRTSRVGLAVRILRDFPMNFEAVRLMGDIVAESGQHEEAVRVYRKALFLHLNNSVLSAVDALPTKRVLAAKVRDARVLMDLANAYFRTSQFSEAVLLYEVVSTSFPAHASGAENNLGVIAYSRGATHDAAIHFRRALELDQKNEAAALALAHLRQHQEADAPTLQH